MKEIILKPILLLALITISLTNNFAQVAISTTGTPAPNSKAVLLLTGANQGFIIPIVNSKGSVNAGATEKGMVVFDDSDKKVYFFDGAAWNQLGGGSSSTTGLRLQGNVLSLDPTGTASIGLSGTAPTATDKGKLFVWDGAKWTTTPTPTTTNQILKWDNTTGAWVLGTDNTGTATTGNLTTTTTGVTIANGTNSVIGTGTSVNIQNATGSQPGLLSSIDFTTFNNKVSAVTASAPLAITGSATSPVINFSGWPANVAGVLTNNGSGSLSWSPAVGVGTVTSVGLAMPSIFTVSNSPVITSGTLTAALTSQSANTIFAAPSGAAGAPTFRTLTALDIPSLSAAQITSGTLPVGVGGTGATSLTGLLVGNGASPFTAIATGTNGQILTVNAGVPSWQPAPTASGTAGGDLTGSYPNPTILAGAINSTKLAVNAVATSNIAANAVDDTKILNVAPGKLTQSAATAGQILKWNGTAWAPATDNVGGGGAPTLNPGQIIVGDGTSNSAATVSLDALLNSTNGNITVQGLQGRPISSSVPATNSVYQYNGAQWTPVVLAGGGTVTNIATGTGLTGGPITSTGTISISAGGVTATELAAAAVTNAKLAANSVNSSQIIDGSIADVDVSGTAAIAVTKLATGTNGQVLTVNAGVPSWQTPSGLANPMTTSGDIITGGVAGVPNRLGIGANSQVLTVSGGVPSWQAAPTATGTAGGDLTGTYPNPTISSTAGTNIITAINGAASLINGARINTSFGAQSISTTGTLTAGATTVTGLTIGTSVWPANAGGVLTNNGTGTLTWGSSLTNPMTTPGDLIYGGAAGVATRLATGAGFLKGGATPLYSAVNLASADVTGTLPIANGGTGATTAPVALTNLGAMSNALTNGNIFVGNGSNVATGVVMSGDATISNTGLLTVGTGAITSAKILDGTIADADISGSAVIAGTKIIPAFGANNISSTGTLSIGGTTTFNTKTYTWPSAALIANTFLQTDATGNLSWAAAAAPFTTVNTVPKGSAGGLVASQIIDDGAHVSINGPIDPLYKFQVYGVNPAIAVDNSGIKIGDVTGGSDGNYFYTDFENTPGKFYFMGGNVGIGTSTPATILDVVGTANTTGLNVTNTNPDIATFKSTSASDNRILFANSGGIFGTLGYTPFNNTFALTTYTNLDLSIGSNNLGTEIMRLKAGGNVGIGTTSVINKLDVEGGVAIGANYSGTNTAPSNGLLVEGSVGIGLTSVTAGTKLEITGGDLRISDSFPFITLNASTSTNNSGFNFIEAGTSKAYIYYKGSSDEIWLSNSSGGGSQHLSIATTGNVGLGRTAVTNQLELSGNASKAIAGSWLANSDKRIKTDILDIDNSLDIIKKLRPVKFKYTSEWMKRNPIIKNQYYYNFIAQEYQNVFPNAVKGSGEFLEGDSKEILQIDTYDAQIVTIKAVQELMKKIETLEKENSELKGINTNLQTEVASLKDKQVSDMDAMKRQLEQIKKVLGMEASAKKVKKNRE